MPTPAEIARFSLISNTDTVTVPITHTTSVGAQLVLVAQAPSVTAETAFTITDSKATWTQRVVQSHASSINSQLVMFTGVVTTAHTTSDTLTLHSVNRSPQCWCVSAIADASLAGYDTSASGTDSSGSMATGNTSVAAQSAELLVAGFAFIDTASSQVITPPAGFTTLAKVSAALATPKGVALSYSYVNTPGARSVSAGLSSSTAWAAGLVAMKSAATATSYRWFNTAGVKVPMTMTQL